MDKEVNADVKINSSDLFTFMVYQNYHSRNGILAIIFGVLCAFMAYYTYGTVKQSYTVIYIIFAVVMLLYEPYSLYEKSKKHLKSNELNEKTWHYKLNKEGFIVSIDMSDLNDIKKHNKDINSIKKDDSEKSIEKTLDTEKNIENSDRNSVFIDWKDVFKVVRTNKALYIYTSRVNAHIIPFRYIGSEWETLSKILYRNVAQYKLKL